MFDNRPNFRKCGPICQFLPSDL